MIPKRDQLQKWSRRLNDICKTKKLWRTLCHLTLWLVHTGSRLRELGRHLQRNEKPWQMPLLSCWRRNFANKLIWCVIFSLMWTHLGNSLNDSTENAIYIVYMREGGRNGELGYHTFIISAVSLYRDWGQTSYFSKTVGQPPPVLPLPKNSNPLSFALSPLSYAMFLSLLCFFWYPISTTHGRELLSISVQLVSNPCLSSCRTLALGNLELSMIFLKSKLNW